MRALLDAGLLHGDALTVTGRTMAENLAEIAPPDPDGKVIRAMSDPIHRTGGLTILRGSLAPEGAVVKIGRLRRATSSRAPPGSSTASGRRWTPSTDGTLQPGDVVRHPLRGPQGRPGHARDARRHRRHQGRRAWARTSCCSPTAGSPAARPGCASATSRPRRSTAARSRSCATATGSGSTSPRGRSTCWSTRPSWPRAGDGWAPLPPQLHPRRAGEVRQAGRQSAAQRRRLRLSRPGPAEARGRPDDRRPRCRDAYVRWLTPPARLQDV